MIVSISAVLRKRSGTLPSVVACQLDAHFCAAFRYCAII